MSDRAKVQLQFAPNQSGNGNYNSTERAWKNRCLSWEEEGRQAIIGARIELREPTRQDLDDEGVYVYQHVRVLESSQHMTYVLDASTDSADRHFLADLSFYRVKFTARSGHASAMVTELVNVWLSPASLEALEAEDTYMALRSSPGPNGFVDSYGIWLLVKKVHHLGSSRAKYRYLTDYLASNDRGLSLDAFLVLLRKQDTLVQDNFADPLHPVT